MKQYLYLILSIFLISLVSAIVIDVNTPELGYTNRDNVWTGSNTFTNITAINYTNINHVNNSQYLQGMTPQEVADLGSVDFNTTQFETGEPIKIKTSWLTSFIETIANSLSKWANYALLSGATFTGDVNVNGNVTTEKIKSKSFEFIEITGACDLNLNGSMCKNSTGTYIIG